MSTKNEYIARMHSKLDHWNAEIDKLVSKADEAKADASSEYRERIADLRGKRDEAKKKLDTLQSAGEGAWEDLKAGVEMAWDAIGEAVESAKARFK